MRLLKKVMLVAALAMAAYPLLLIVASGVAALVGDGAGFDYWLREGGRRGFGEMLLRDWVSSLGVAAVIATGAVVVVQTLLERYRRVGGWAVAVGTGVAVAVVSAAWLGSDAWNIVLFALTGTIWMGLLLVGLRWSGAMRAGVGR